LYARFCVQLISDPRFDVATLINDFEMESVTSVRERLSQAVESVPDPALSLRMRRVFLISVMIMADYARQVEAGNALPVEEAIEEATQSLVGFLLA